MTTPTTGGKTPATTTNCIHCGHPVRQNEYGGWVHEILGVGFCASQSPETVYNNWDKRTAWPNAKTCIYCGELEGHDHKGFCLTRIEGAREEYEVRATE